MTATDRALRLLADAGTAGLSAGMLGAKLWPDRKGRVSSVNGGGDYAAQMLLGRMRKAGLARTQHRDGSSIWELTAAGRARAARLP